MGSPGGALDLRFGSLSQDSMSTNNSQNLFCSPKAHGSNSVVNWENSNIQAEEIKRYRP